MAKGAPDHHLPLEKKLDDIVSQLQTVVTDIDADIDESVLTLTNKLTVLVAAVNNLKTTLTNLNIMPPVAETPWAVKNIGKAGLSYNWVNIYAALEWETLLDVSGSGQVLSLILRMESADVQGRQTSQLEITVDGVEIFDHLVATMFVTTPLGETWAMGTLGTVANTGNVYAVYYNVPLYYAANMKIRWRNNSTTTTSNMAWIISYTNLP